MRSCRSLVLPIAIAAAAPAHATQVCAWMEETIEPYEEEAPAEDEAAEPFDAATAAEAAADAAAAAAEDYVAVDAEDDVMAADDQTAAAAAEAAQAAVDAANAAAGDPAAESEYAEPGLLNLKLWLQADGDADFYYKIAGEGLVEDSGNRIHSPNSGTFVLSRGAPNSPWSVGMTFAPPGRIDVILEVREWPDDIFSDDDPPLLASFAFRRRIPEGEADPPKTLAQHQCQDIAFPPRRD